MPFCSNCGSEHAASAAFCITCGSALAPTPAGSAASPPTAPYVTQQRALPPPPTGTGPAPALPKVDWQRILVGNWLGAGLVAGTALAVSGLLSLALVAMAKPEDFGIDNSLTLVATLMTGAFGADLAVEADASGESFDATIGAFPFTVTLLALGAALLVFRRVTARYVRWVDAVGDAIRAALLFGLGLLVVAIVFRADGDEFGRGWGREIASTFDGRVEWGADVAGAVCLGFLCLFAVLLAGCWVRRDWWPARLQRVRDWLVAPLYGVGVFAALLPLAGLVGLVLSLVTGDVLEDNDPTDDDLSAALALLFAALASGGYWFLALGAGAALGSEGEESGSGGSSSDSESHHLKYFADDAPGLWAAPVVMVAVLIAASWVVARRSPPGKVFGNLLVWVGVVLVTMPLFVRLTSVHARAEAGQYDATGSAGVVGWQATLLLTLSALVCALLVALLTRSLSLGQLRTAVAAFGSRIQSNPSVPRAPEAAAAPAPPASPAGRPPGAPPYPVPPGAPRGSPPPAGAPPGWPGPSPTRPPSGAPSTPGWLPPPGPPSSPPPGPAQGSPPAATPEPAPPPPAGPAGPPPPRPRPDPGDGEHTQIRPPKQ